MKNTNQNVLLLGVSFTSDNKGVNALGIGAATLIYQQMPSADISVLCINKGQWQTTFNLNLDGGVKTLSIYNVRLLKFLSITFIYTIQSLFGIKSNNKVIELIRSKELVFNVNEGDSFSDIYGFKRILRHFCDSHLAIILGKKLIFLPQTIGPFSTTYGKYMAKYILKNCYKIFVRDKKAFPFLNQIPVSYTLQKDMAVFMQPKENRRLNIPDNSIGLNVNGLMYFNSYASMKGKYDNYREFIYKLIDALSKLKCPIYLIPHTYNAVTPNGEDDLLAVKDLIKQFPSNSLLNVIDGDYDAQELKYLVSQCDFFMGSRMHSCIAGLSTSVPTIGLAYSYKFEGTFLNFNQQDRVLDLSSLTINNIPVIIENIIEIYKHREEIRTELRLNNESTRHFLVTE